MYNGKKIPTLLNKIFIQALIILMIFMWGIPYLISTSNTELYILGCLITIPFIYKSVKEISKKDYKDK